MQIVNIICQLATAGLCLLSLYMCNSYRKMLSKSHERFMEAHKLVDAYKELYENEKRKR